MTIIKDSDVFSIAGSGGSTMKSYVSGMSVLKDEVVRSASTSLPFVRYSSTPTSLTVTTDPADPTMASHFIVDDPTTPIGAVMSMPDTISSQQPAFYRYGQLWLRSGSYVLASAYDGVANTRPIPKDFWIYYDWWTKIKTTTEAGASGKFMTMAGDGSGNWLGINNSGQLYKSVDDGVTWTLMSGYTGGGVTRPKITTNKQGRWWICNDSGNIYASDNLGTSWTQWQTPTTPGAPYVFKYVNDRLIYSPPFYYQTGTSVGNTTICQYLLSTATPTTAWTALTCPSNAVYTAIGAGSYSALLYDVIGDGGTKMWFASIITDNVRSLVSTLDTSNTAWAHYCAPQSVNTIYGISYDAAANAAVIGCAYSSSGSVSQYETSIANGILAYTSSPFVTGITNTATSNCNDGAAYLRRNGSAIVMLGASQSSQLILFRLTGGSMPAVADQNSRQPAVTGVAALGSYGFMGIAEAGNTAIAYGSFLSISKPVIGVRTARSAGVGLQDYMRIQ